MSEADWFLQANVKINDQLINVRGVDANDLLVNLEALAEMSGRFTDAMKLIAAATQEINPRTSGPAKSDWKPPANTGGSASGGSASGGPSCAHGVRNLKRLPSGKEVWECSAVADGSIKWNDPDACKGEWKNSRR